MKVNNKEYIRGYQFDFTTIKGQKACYMHMYILINGVIEIDKLIEILNTNHDLKIDKDELLEIISGFDDIEIKGSYLCISGLSRELIYQTMQLKKIVGTYKVIDKLEETEKQYNNTVIDINNICREFFDDNTAIDLIRSIMFLSGITSQTLNVTLKNRKIILSNYNKLSLQRKLEECQKNVRVWSYNGFTKDELLKLKGKE